MNNDFIDKIKKIRADEAEKRAVEQRDKALIDAVSGAGTNPRASGTDQALIGAIQSLETTVQRLLSASGDDANNVAALNALADAINRLDVSPVVKIPTPKVTVNERELDLGPLKGVLEDLRTGVGRLEVSETTFDTSDLRDGLSAVEGAVRDLIAKPIPVPEVPLAFRNATTGAQGLVDSDGHVQVDVLSGGGGGTQYTEGDTDATITGTAVLWEDTGDTLRAVSTAKPLPGTPFGKYSASFTSLTDGQTAQHRMTPEGYLMTAVSSGVAVNGTVQVEGTFDVLEQRDIASPTASALPLNVSLVNASGAQITDFATQTTLSAMNAKFVNGTDIGDVTINNASGASAVNIQDGGNSITVDGSITANAGTNLNTSALALESGGNLAGAATSLAVIDDWDESDRAKVNPIVGQAGVQGGSGVVSATTQRVVLATDVALPAGTNAIGKLAANSGVDIGDVDVTSLPVAFNAGAVSSTTQRVVEANGTGRTLTSTGGSASSSGNNTLVAAGTNRLKVYAFSLSTTSTTAVTCIFQSGASGTELWRVVLQAPTSVSTGANLVVQPPAWLFATASATLLNLNLSSAQTVHWSVSYYDEA